MHVKQKNTDSICEKSQMKERNLKTKVSVKVLIEFKSKKEI